MACVGRRRLGRKLCFSTDCCSRFVTEIRCINSNIAWRFAAGLQSDVDFLYLPIVNSWPFQAESLVYFSVTILVEIEAGAQPSAELVSHYSFGVLRRIFHKRAEDAYSTGSQEGGRGYRG